MGDLDPLVENTEVELWSLKSASREPSSRPRSTSSSLLPTLDVIRRSRLRLKLNTTEGMGKLIFKIIEYVGGGRPMSALDRSNWTNQRRRSRLFPRQNIRRAPVVKSSYDSKTH